MILKFLTLATAMFLVGAPSTYAMEASESVSLVGKSFYRFQPCNSWRINQNGQGYVCNFPDASIRVPDLEEVKELKQRLETLEAQVVALTNRVSILENGGSVDSAAAKN